MVTDEQYPLSAQHQVHELCGLVCDTQGRAKAASCQSQSAEKVYGVAMYTYAVELDNGKIVTALARSEERAKANVEAGLKAHGINRTVKSVRLIRKGR
jgi:hypothetical protein